MKEYILVVEDDNDINRMLKELLEGQGYETAQAFSGTEALLYLEKRVPDGADDFIVKPFDTQELLARLEAVLRRLGRVKRLETTEERFLYYGKGDYGLYTENRKSDEGLWKKQGRECGKYACEKGGYLRIYR